jgi:hypothetical protein
MKNLVKVALIATLFVGVFGCGRNLMTRPPRMRVLQAADAGVEPSKAEACVKTTTTPAAKAAAAKEKLMIPSGTIRRVLLIDGLSTETNSAGDQFVASPVESIVVDGSIILPKGTKVRGHVIGVEDSGRVKGVAGIRLVLTDIMQSNRTVAITTDTFAATAESSTTRDAEIIGGGAGVGAVIGAIAGGKGAGIGAISGGRAGTGVVLATKGKEIRYAPETRLSFTLANPVQM